MIPVSLWMNGPNYHCFFEKTLFFLPEKCNKEIIYNELITHIWDQGWFNWVAFLSLLLGNIGLLQVAYEVMGSWLL